MGNKLIFERTAAAIRRQDWFAVAIEFTLVVASVLLAFQITEWANDRDAHKERAAATERLLGEAEQNVAFMRLGVSTQQLWVDDLNFALSQVQRGRWQPADEKRMTMGLSRATFAVPSSPPSAVYQDLVSSGSIGRIGDAQMRSAIAKYRATLDFVARVIDYMQGSMPDLEDHAAFRYAFDPDGRRRARLDVDYQALRGDQSLQEKLAILADKQRVLLLFMQRGLKHAERMCAEIGRVADRPCNQHLPPPTFD